MPYNVEVKKNVALSRAKIFAALTDFGGVAKILPEAIKTCTLVGSGVGSVRNIVLADGGTVSERLEMAHNQSVFAYSITANTALPVENYFACVTPGRWRQWQHRCGVGQQLDRQGRDGRGDQADA